MIARENARWIPASSLGTIGALLRVTDRIVVLLVAVLASACGRVDFTHVPDQVGIDAGTIDAAMRDAGPVDADPPRPDAGDDARVVDASRDAGLLDGGCTDCCCATMNRFATAPIPTICGGVSDGAQFSFETDAQGWSEIDNAGVVYGGRTAVSEDRAFAGRSSLRATITLAANDIIYAYVVPPASIVVGDVLTFRVWLPPGATLDSIQPYIMDADFVWSGEWIQAANLSFGCWNEIQVPVPADFVAPFFQMGVQFATLGTAYSGEVYIDNVEW
jgi:hypothetical protein